jgi:hypothetical protein
VLLHQDRAHPGQQKQVQAFALWLCEAWKLLNCDCIAELCRAEEIMRNWEGYSKLLLEIGLVVGGKYFSLKSIDIVDCKTCMSTNTQTDDFSSYAMDFI